MEKILYITHQYPNVGGDTAFIETEMKYVSKKMDEVYVLSHGNINKECVAVPSNVHILYFNFRKNKLYTLLLCISSLFNSYFWKEVRNIIVKKKKLCCLKEALLFLVQAEKEAKQIQKIITKNKIRLLYTFWFYRSTLACIIAKLKLGIDEINIFTRTHRSDLYELRNQNNYQAYKIQMTDYVKKIFFISKEGKEYYMKTFDSDQSNKYKLSYLGTENPTPLKQHTYEKSINLLSVSYVVPVKRIFLIVDSLVRCSKENISIKWTHIGGGSDFFTIKNLAEENLNNTSISFNFIGELPNQKVHEYYRTNDVDLFVNMSESEGLPVSMMEAMSFGVPVIATDVGGVREIVDSHSGWLLSKDLCNEEFVEVIKEWCNYSSEQKKQKSQNAYNKWNLYFNAEINYQTFSNELLKE